MHKAEMRSLFSNMSLPAMVTRWYGLQRVSRSSFPRRPQSVPSRNFCLRALSPSWRRDALRFNRPTSSLRGPRGQRYHGSSSQPQPRPTAPTPNPSSADAPLSLSQRMRRLSREYGYSALGIYLLLSALDFPFCFVAVRTLGTDRIGRWEHTVMETIRRAIPLPAVLGGGGDGDKHHSEEDSAVEPSVVPSLEEASRRSAEPDASLWTQLVLAYAIHKSFIVFRVPLTAAVTPKVVKTLRRWGWDIGKKRSKK